MAKEITDETVSQLSAHFAPGKIPTEAAFYSLIDWATLWRQLFGWQDGDQAYHPGVGLQVIDNRLVVKTGDGIALAPEGLALKLQLGGGLMLDKSGVLSVDGTVAVSAQAFKLLPEETRKQIAGLLLNAGTGSRKQGTDDGD
ncbi:hypothetical protein LGZ99_14245 [Photorhabdus temperata]|uniref:Uncharacterized protein n=1 Tax=Photorhabdus temperata subsp. temperata Meg1 TaxID=1393735 RepID=A0A081RYA9_PHOTE|nr:hypothetical protein [Photorhabdus temperata]KER03662.1 hypothetical protein MEG1DRAFT_01583 [Photorhabdus temperata subsp. temperata Meg1]MCT8348327.1 hypothetical protein [Photorhabdus temperata]